MPTVGQHLQTNGWNAIQGPRQRDYELHSDGPATLGKHSVEVLPAARFERGTEAANGHRHG